MSALLTKHHLKSVAAQSKLAGMMKIQPMALITLAVAALLWPSSAFAKRRAPDPVPPVVWQGVEYRAPLDVEHLGCVQAFDLSSGRKLWEDRVYHVWINPLIEEDVQWVFISAMKVEDGKLLIRNENGNSFRLDLKTGRIEGAMYYGMAWFIAGGLLLLVFLAWIRARRHQRVHAPNRGPMKSEQHDEETP